MIHARADYNRIQDPAVDDPSLVGLLATPIGEDEPVMLFRAQDKHFIGVLLDYRKRLIGSGEAKFNMIEAIDQQVLRAREWQAQHPPKVPDL